MGIFSVALSFVQCFLVVVQQTKAVGINISRLTEKPIAASIGKRTYMHVQSDIETKAQDLELAQNESDLEKRG